MHDEHQAKPGDCTRRAFIKAGGAATAALLAGTALPASASRDAVTGMSALPTRAFGRTGHQVSIFSLGGQAALEKASNEAIAVPIIERALDLGVNYIDTSSIYGGPLRWSEQYVGQVMKRRRTEAFLASKTKERTRDGSLRMLEQSLKLLNTDHLDLWQLHDIGTQHDIDEVFATGGAVEALLEARDQKMVRFLGITGHHRPESLMEGIRRLPFDAVLMAVSAADVHHYSFASQLLPFAVQHQMGIVGMKVTGRGRILSSWTPPPVEKQQHSWEGVVIADRSGTLTMQEALHYTLTLPVSTVIVGCDTIAQLEENVALTRQFRALTAAQMAVIEAKAAPVSKQALFFRFFERP
jgi:uncharacterized protein